MKDFTKSGLKLFIRSGLYYKFDCIFFNSTTPGPEVIKKFPKLKLRSQVFDWSKTSSECTLSNENPEISDRNNSITLRPGFII